MKIDQVSTECIRACDTCKMITKQDRYNILDSDLYFCMLVCECGKATFVSKPQLVMGNQVGDGNVMVNNWSNSQIGNNNFGIFN